MKSARSAPRAASLPSGPMAASVLRSLEAAQLELAQVGELEPGTGKEVSHRAGHEHLAGLGAIQDSGRRMDREAADVVADDLDLAGVDRRPDLKVERLGHRPHRLRARKGPGGRVERAMKPSPVVLTSTPWNCSIARRVASL